MKTRSFYERVVKRPMDLAVAVLVALLTSPVHALCSIMVLVTSGRPIYFRQERAGKGGQPFDVLKIRTMKVGAHDASGGYPTSDLITPVGRVLRKTSLDELPQLINIVKGDMSLVGPRPALMDQVVRYTDQQAQRLSVRPGVTGLAQVRYRNNAPWSVRIESDLEYVSRISFWTDVAIILRTVPAVLFGVGVATGQTATEVDDLGQEQRDLRGA